MQLAFVLLERPIEPDPARLLAALERDSPMDGPFEALPKAPDDPEDGPLGLQMGDGSALFVMNIAAPVPDEEAEAAVRFSVSALGTGWELPVHRAQLVATVHEDEDDEPMERLLRFTRMLAALIDAVDGVVGVYWGSAGATHAPDFFRQVALDGESLPIMLWNGVSIAGDEDQLSLLSLGMDQLGLPDLKLDAPRHQGNDALGFFFDLLAYVARRGEPIPEGETVGRNDEEKLRVRYEPSPVDPEADVACVDLPPLH